MKMVASLLVTASLVGCAFREPLQTRLDRYIGQPESTLVGRFGPPANAYSLQDGSRVIQYFNGSTIVVPGAVTARPVISNTTGNVSVGQGYKRQTGTYNQQTTTFIEERAPSQSLTFSCTKNFIIDRDGLIRSWSANGDCF